MAYMQGIVTVIKDYIVPFPDKSTISFSVLINGVLLFYPLSDMTL